MLALFAVPIGSARVISPRLALHRPKTDVYVSAADLRHNIARL